MDACNCCCGLCDHHSKIEGDRTCQPSACIATGVYFIIRITNHQDYLSKYVWPPRLTFTIHWGDDPRKKQTKTKIGENTNGFFMTSGLCLDSNWMHCIVSIGWGGHFRETHGNWGENLPETYGNLIFHGKVRGFREIFQRDPLPSQARSLRTTGPVSPWPLRWWRAFGTTSVARTVSSAAWTSRSGPSDSWQKGASPKRNQHGIYHPVIRHGNGKKMIYHWFS